MPLESAPNRAFRSSKSSLFQTEVLSVATAIMLSRAYMESDVLKRDDGTPSLTDICFPPEESNPLARWNIELFWHGVWI